MNAFKHVTLILLGPRSLGSAQIQPWALNGPWESFLSGGSTLEQSQASDPPAWSRSVLHVLVQSTSLLKLCQTYCRTWPKSGTTSIFQWWYHQPSGNFSFSKWSLDLFVLLCNHFYTLSCTICIVGSTSYQCTVYIYTAGSTSYLTFLCLFESDVTYSQVWWHILGISALHLSHPKCTHTQQWTHTHCEQCSGQPFMLRRPGGSWGFGALLKGNSVVVLRVKKALYIHSPHLQFLPDQDLN